MTLCIVVRGLRPRALLHWIVHSYEGVNTPHTDSYHLRGKRQIYKYCIPERVIVKMFILRKLRFKIILKGRQSYYRTLGNELFILSYF